MFRWRLIHLTTAFSYGFHGRINFILNRHIQPDGLNVFQGIQCFEVFARAGVDEVPL